MSVDAELKAFGRWRTSRVYDLAAEQEDRVHGSLILALYSRETNMRNIVGGGYFEDGVWHSTGVDRGLGQLNEVWHADWLASVAGCKSGEYTPSSATALPRGFVPGLTDQTRKVIEILNSNVRQARVAGVPEEDEVRVALAGYNGGIVRAITAYKKGKDPDSVTTGGDYSKDILARQKLIRSAVRKRGWA